MAPRTRPTEDRGPRPARALILGLAACFGFALAAAADLYQWTDAQGVIRYTPHPSRVPGGYTAVPVETGMSIPPPHPNPSAPSAYTSGPEADVPGGADPFNAPGQARSIRGEAVAPGGVPSEFDARITELEDTIARDQETLMILISRASAEDGSADPLANSEELREIAHRLPDMQADLQRLLNRRALQQRR